MRRPRKTFNALEDTNGEEKLLKGLCYLGLIAMATKGIRVDGQRREHATLLCQLNFSGEAGPLKLTQITTRASDHTPAPVLVHKDIGKGIGHSSKAIVAVPLEMWNALALRFRNTPNLYGDKTVRPSEAQKIKSFRSGARIAGKEFWRGLYNGVTGVARLPYLEVQDAGMSALPKSVAQGLGALVLKPLTGVIGLGAYTAKGVQQSLRRRVRHIEKTDR